VDLKIYKLWFLWSKNSQFRLKYQKQYEWHGRQNDYWESISNYLIRNFAALRLCEQLFHAKAQSRKAGKYKLIEICFVRFQIVKEDNLTFL